MNKNIVLTGLTVVLLFSLAGCSSQKNTTPSSNIEKNSSTRKETETTTTKNSLQETLKTEDTNPLSKDEKVESMLDSLNQGMSQMFDISFDEKNDRFLLEAKKNGQMDTMLSGLENNTDSDNKQQLEELSTSLTGFSESISDSLGKNYSIELINSYNDKGSFFVIKNGKISFPYFENK